jgi:uncharacterized protein YqgC (DUF456 family)
MSAGENLLVGAFIVLGLLGIVLPVVPGVTLIMVAIGFWAVVESSREAWAVFAIAALVIAISQYVKYAVPHRQLKSAGVPSVAILVGAVAGIVGFFVIPVIGLPIGFIGGIYLTLVQRGASPRTARNATYAAMKAVGVSILIELAGGLLAAACWLLAVVVLV